MSGEKEYILWSKKDLENFCKQVQEENTVEEPLRVTIKDYKPRRTLKSNALYWLWLDYLSRKFSEKMDNNYTKKDLHDICRHKFLGTEERVYNNTKIEGQLVDTRKLDVGEFYDYMTQIDDWALGMKIILPRPAKNEYDDLKKTQKGGT